MISKEKITKAVVCYWSAEDESFVAESAILPHVVIGVGDSVEEAMKSFEDALNNVYDEIESDNVAGYKMGRPAKGYVQFNTNIRPTSRASIAELARELDLSQGEVVDFLVFYRECKLQELSAVPKESELAKELRELKQQIAVLSQKIDPPNAITWIGSVVNDQVSSYQHLAKESNEP